MPEPPATQSDVAAVRAEVRALVDTARLAAEAFGRPDLAAAQQLALQRLDRPETLIAVIGEFKQGKSSLVNALLNEPLAPVDDDLATAVLTLFRYAESPGATLLRRSGDEDVRERVALDEVERFISEQSNRDNAASIERVEIAVPNEFLATGAVIVDTPGFGGLAPGYGGMTLAYLRAVDAVVFVSDASSPLSRPELECLARAIDACPAVIVALTKTDLYPQWRQIEADDTATLARAGVDVPVLAISSALMEYGRKSGDRSLEAESGIPTLRDMIETLVVDAARSNASHRALAESLETLDQLRSAAVAELAALEDPATAEGLARELERQQSQLDRLRGPGLQMVASALPTASLMWSATPTTASARLSGRSRAKLNRRSKRAVIRASGGRSSRPRFANASEGRRIACCPTSTRAGLKYRGGSSPSSRMRRASPCPS